jgi:uncharacterized membrane protein (DUF4010 family)
VDLSLVAQKVAIALGLGLLVGLTRERVQSPLAGIRTFALITVLGSVCALLGLTFGGWIVGLGGIAVASMLVVGNLAQGKAAEVEPGVTTEMAALLALIFGGLYALVLLGVAAVHDYLGPSGLYSVAVISGLHDLDAITLSTARFMEQGQVEAQLGWRLILAGSLSNLVLKSSVVAILGDRSLLKWIALPYGAALLGGMALLLLWP